MINAEILSQKIQTLSRYEVLNKSTLEKFESILKELDDWSLNRINPLAFAEKYQIPQNECIDLFIHSSKIGLFDFSYNMLCPKCGGIAHTHDSLDQIESEKFYCAVCDVNSNSDLDDQVEVSFTINPSVKVLDLKIFDSPDNYFRYYFSPNYQKPKELRDYVSGNIKQFMILNPDETREVEIDSTVNPVYQFSSIEKNSTAFIHFDSSVKKDTLELDLIPKGFTNTEAHIAGGKTKVKLKNLTKEKLGIPVITPNTKKLMEIIAKHPTTIIPFYTGKMLLNTQSFRDLYRMQNLSKDLNLNIKSLTILFTDLRGSTEMYDRAGDLLAYQLVQEHFVMLIDIVRKYSGTVVKTMGDAIMATFSNPMDGFLTSLEMFTKIDSLNTKWKEKGYELGLKVGIHEGTALAVVNDERLDYFGHTVNVAARVQGLAKAGEVWLSESIFNSPGVEDTLKSRGYKYEKHTAVLKGVGESAVVYKCYHLN